MGRAAWVLVWICAAATVANAQPGPLGAPPPIENTPDEAPAPPPPSEQPVVATPAPAVTQPPASRHSLRDHVVSRRGPYVLLGLSHLSDTTFALVHVGMPVPLAQAPSLRIRAEGSIYYERVNDTRAMSWGVALGAQYDWRLPVKTTTADLVVAAGGGVSMGQARYRLPDEPFYPSKWESITLYGLEVDGAIEYRRAGGLIVRLVPIELGVALNEPETTDPRVMISSGDVGYTVSLAAGYQLP